MSKPHHGQVVPAGDGARTGSSAGVGRFILLRGACVIHGIPRPARR